MDPVEYSLLLQKAFSILSGICFFGLTLMLSVVDPIAWPQALYVLLIVCFLFIWSILVLLNFWWYTSIRKIILPSQGINYVVLRQGLLAVLLIFSLTFIITKMLNIGLLSLLLAAALLIILWIPIRH